MAVSQDESRVVLAPKLTKETGKIEWEKPAKTISNLIRGANPWPGTYTSLNGEILKIYRAKIISGTNTRQPGRICFIQKEGIGVETADGLLLLTEVQKANKKRMNAYEFTKGQRIAVGSFLGK